MKKSQLKLLITKIIKESIEGVIQKGPDYNHKFDDGRYPVMGAVNVAETHNLIGIPTLDKDIVKVRYGSGIDSGKIGVIVKTKFKQTNGGMIPDEPGAYKPQPIGWLSVKFDDGHISSFPRNRLERASRINPKLKENRFLGGDDRVCDCGSGLPSEWEYDAQNIPLCRACPKCKQKKLARYRPEILRGYTQADVDEPIEPEDDRYEESVVKEKIGFDGKYVDDMESGVAVKKLHSLDETPDYKQKFVYPENFKQVKNYIRIVRRPETNEFVVTWYENGRLNEDKSYFTDDIKDAWDTFNHMKPSVDKTNSTMNEGLYPEVTLQMNRMGHIHMWKGKVEPIQISKYNYTVKGKESEVYFQNDADVNEILRSLSPEEGKELEEGWPVVTTNISDEYFGLNEMSSTGGSSGSGMGYSTPYAFSKKGGSKRALDVTKKMGFKKVKDID